MFSWMGTNEIQDPNNPWLNEEGGNYWSISSWFEGGETTPDGSPIISIPREDFIDPNYIFPAQCCFVIMLSINVTLISYIGMKYLKVPKILFYFLIISQRMYKLAVLRLFNDVPTMMIAHFSLYLFCQEKIFWGCIFYSLACSMKMNIYLMAPGLAWYLWKRFPIKIDDQNQKFIDTQGIILTKKIMLLKIAWQQTNKKYKIKK